MISIEEAFERLMAAIAPLPPVEVSLEYAYGRVVAEEIRADRDVPAADRSAMDGFAVHAADVREAGAILRVAGEVRAGEPAPAAELPRGEAVRIFTGALLPPGADAVVMLEATELGSDPARVRLCEPAERGQNVRARASDRRAGEIVLLPGDPIHAAEMAALAALGRPRVRVHRAPDVRILATGDEVVPVAATPGDHQVRNSNAWGLRAQLRELGLTARDGGIAPDDREGLRARLREGLQGDVLLVTGGVSVGAYDLVADVLKGEGLTVLFHGVAMRPGKPLLAGRCGDCLVFGLPGNPLSTFATFLVFVGPALRRLMGYTRCAPPCLKATLRAPLARRPGRTSLHVGRVLREGDGLVAEPLPSTGSGDVLSLVRANAFLVTEPGKEPQPEGSTIAALLWPEAGHR
ncbi:MAG TPA: gephyrin-like molybdotransferase Glp [Candidatus Polarisedimenticolaceae bacterium]|nr:gephyrin-like molybdotransferase Glp [Candidatus Polarisedimenticolaceae bacterium]